MRVVDGQKLLMAHREAMQDQEDRPCDGVPIIEEVPDFRSQIPPEILAKLSKEQQALFALVSKIEQAQAWGNQNDVVHNKAIHRLCKSTDALNTKINFWTTRYGWIFAILGVVATTALVKLVGWAFDSLLK
jgi:hypothetical protein